MADCAASKTEGQSHGAWLDATRSICVEVSAGGKPGVLMVDFNAG